MKTLSPAEVRRKKSLIKKIHDLEKKINQARSALSNLLEDEVETTGITVHTRTEDKTQYACKYRAVKSGDSSSHVLVRIDKMKRDGCTVDIISIPLTESIPATEGRGLAGYCRLGKSRTYVPQYFVLDRSHLRKARRKNAKQKRGKNA